MSVRVNSVRLAAPAKLNLSLSVLGRRADGYHQLSSLFAYCDWCDWLDVTPLPGDAGNRIQLETRGPQTPTGLAVHDNLVVRAYDFAVQHFGPLPAVTVTLTKTIPSGAGLGGGSSDAAALLRWAAGRHAITADSLAPAVITAMRHALGADCYPIFEGCARLWGGTGDQPGAPLTLDQPLYVLVVFSGAFVSTGDIFRGLGKAEGASDDTLAPRAPRHELAQGGNDLQAVAARLCPAIANLLDALHHACTNTGNAWDDAIKIQMTGSGSACFALFRDLGRAREAAQHPRLVRLPQFVGPLKLWAWAETPNGKI